MIKINWKQLLIERGFLGFQGYLDPTAESGTDFCWFWEPCFKDTRQTRILIDKITRQ